MAAADYARRFACQIESLPFVFPQAAWPAMKTRTKPDKWSAHETLAHLALHNGKTADRVRRILAEEAPGLASYKAETEPVWPTLLAMSSEALLDQFLATRAALTRLIGECDDGQLRRIGVHAQFGAFDLGEWLELFLIHEAHHFYAIAIAARIPPSI